MINRTNMRQVMMLVVILAVAGLGWPRAGRGLDGQWAAMGAGADSGLGVSASTGEATRPDVAVGPDGEIVLAWSDTRSGNAEIYVKQWHGGAWQEVGSQSASGGGISNSPGPSTVPSVAVGSNGVIYVAWEDGSSGNQEIYVRRFMDGAWSEMKGSASKGGISNTIGDSRAPSLGLGPEDLPYVAWEESGDGDSEIYVRRWNANSWGEVGAGSASGGGISDNSGDSTLPSLAVDGAGNVFVAWADKGGGDTEIYARSFAGGGWIEMGAGSATGAGVSDNSGTSRNVDLTLAADGTVYLAWSDDSAGNYEIYVRQWDGAWSEVGAGSATGGGVSQNIRHSHAPRIVIDQEGRPAVVWYQATAADAEIFLRRWSGTNWEELGGSGSGNGLSNNAGASSHPVVAAIGQTIAVAWNDNGPGSYAIYARRWATGDDPTPTSTAITTPTGTATATLTGTPTGTATTTATATSTATTSATPTATATLATPVATPTKTETPASTPTATTVATGTSAPYYLPAVVNQPPSPTPTDPPVPTVTHTARPTTEPTITRTLQPPPSSTPTSTRQATATSVASLTPLPSPTRTAVPSPTPTRPPQGGCSICSYDAYNCSDFRTQSAAQSCYNYCMGVVGYDVHRLDANNDGIACESLPLVFGGWIFNWP